MPKDAPPNGGASPRRLVGPRRVSEMQAKLHRWAVADPGRRFDDLFNLVHDPATLRMALARVASNTGHDTPGVDGWTVAAVEETVGVAGFLDDLRAQVKNGSFRPLPVRQLTQTVAAAKNTDNAASIPSDVIRRREAISLLVAFSDTG